MFSEHLETIWVEDDAVVHSVDVDVSSSESLLGLATAHVHEATLQVLELIVVVTLGVSEVLETSVLNGSILR